MRKIPKTINKFRWLPVIVCRTLNNQLPVMYVCVTNLTIVWIANLDRIGWKSTGNTFQLVFFVG